MVHKTAVARDKGSVTAQTRKATEASRMAVKGARRDRRDLTTRYTAKLYFVTHQ